jgi:hypothetical protein
MDPRATQLTGAFGNADFGVWIGGSTPGARSAAVATARHLCGAETLRPLGLGVFHEAGGLGRRRVGRALGNLLAASPVDLAGGVLQFDLLPRVSYTLDDFPAVSGGSVQSATTLSRLRWGRPRVGHALSSHRAARPLISEARAGIGRTCG